MEKILGILNSWFVALLMWFLNNKQDESAKHKAEKETLLLDYKIEDQEKLYEEAKNNADNKVLTFKSLRQLYSDQGKGGSDLQ
jgi:hypothetical protein